EWEPRLDDVVVPAPTHGDALVEVVRSEERLAQSPDAALALEADPELLSDRARPAVAADQVARAHRRPAPAPESHPRRHPGGVLLEALQRASEADGDLG